MAGYVRLGDVSTWYDEHGAGEPLVLLHPGGADSRAWDTLVETNAARFHVFTPDRRGHGRTADVPGPISYDLMAADTAAFLETVVGGPAHLVGWSDGAIVALHTALRRPVLARRAVLTAGVFHHEGWIPGILDLDEETTELLRCGYAEVSPDGPEHYPVAVVPGTSHGLLVEKPALCNTMIIDLLTLDPVPTYAPIRRAKR